MSGLLRAALVIARRDFVATVASRSFILFLLGPLLALAFGLTIGKVTDQSDRAALRPKLVVITDRAGGAEVTARYARLSAALGEDPLPALAVVAPERDGSRQIARLVGARAAVLAGWPNAPHLFGTQGMLDRAEGLADLLTERTAQTAPVARVPVTLPAGKAASGSTERHLLARAGQTLVFMLTVLLAGMMLSTLVEEKANKVIEVLASAVPVDAIFLGKLLAMLGVSLTGITLWGSVLVAAAAAALPAGAAFPVPAVGWPAYVVLLLLYYVANYMIIGGVFLGVGSQAASVREVQTLSLPATMAQLAILALASTAVGDLSRPVVLFATAFPFSTPLTMAARAAQEGALWPHLLALLWSGLWAALILRFAAARFRRGVLRSGASHGRAVDKRVSK